MSKICVLYGYNAYNNRIIKKKATFAEYQALITPADNETPAEYKGFVRDKINFDYQDGVYAKLVFNVGKKDDTVFKIDEPNYCVVEQPYKENETTYQKLSRWFILEARRIRGLQYEISLRRDLLADYYDEVKVTPAFIERGIPEINDPAIFNRESFTYNQIKKAELLLDFNKLSGKGKGWVVGYIAREENPTDIGPCVGHAKIPVDVPQWTDLPVALRSLITNGQGYYNETNAYELDFLLRVNNSSNGDMNDYRWFNVNSDSNGLSCSYSESLSTFPGKQPYIYYKYRDYPTGYNLNQVKEDLLYQIDFTSGAYGIGTDLETWYQAQNLPNRFNDFSLISSYNNIVYEKDGKYYKLRVTAANDLLQGFYITPAQMNQGSGDSPAVSVDLRSLVIGHILRSSASISVVVDPAADSSKDAFFIGKKETLYTFVAEEADYDEVKVTLTKERNENLDAPYDLFCIPIGPVSVKNNDVTVFTNVDNVALAISRGISVKGGSKIYDIQVLPYCPFAEIINADGDIEISGFVEDEDFSYITKTIEGVDYNVGIVIYPKSCKGTFDMSIPSNSDVYDLCIEETNSVIEKKIKAETQLCRFVSPNFASIFEINIQKNKGIVNLNVDYFYKPYSPYIHVAPYFNGLYGEDFNDPKGLICSGDFSIASTSSQWEEYQIQNKNYELIFNRQLQNLDINNSIAYEQLQITGKLGVATAAIQGVAAGAVTGATAGSVAGPWGAAAGAVVGAAAGGISSGVASSYGAKMDLEYLSRAQKEARSYMVDMYTYNLGNIQAIPYSLTRVSAFTQNNKVFPFIEFYESTNEEKQALRDKITYNGMTVMRIGRIMDFIGDSSKYVQAQLIRLLNIKESNHVIAEIASEIKEGAYYYGTDSE